MSIAVLTPTDSGDDFDRWEHEPPVEPTHRNRPSRRVVKDEAIRLSLDLPRHRTHERRD
ncbi:hypothetical protein [Actinoplanes rectilineatus]|uniref:hypothetical protein n=1 Tax=Actinoplanes rectilineatus TaxID=113571 RepID=UPI000ADB9BD8|nr:hypothetical protein [Actinoplanes rectilineatus]